MRKLSRSTHLSAGKNAARPRRGAIYLVVIMSSLMVASIGLASLQLVRIQSRTTTAAADFAEARTYARAALDIGMLRIRNDSDWRTRYGNGNWITNQPIGNGSITLTAVDPIDNDVRLGDNHPILLTGIGSKGEARFRTSLRMEIGPRSGSCLEVSLISGEDLSVAGAALTSDHILCSNSNITGSGGATVNADVEAFGTISGSTFTKAKAQRTVRRDLPNPQRVLDFYTANGTAMPYTALTRWTQPELLTNTRFETNIVGWSAFGSCTLQQSNAQARQGQYSLLVKSRGASSAVAVQELPIGSVSSGSTYQVSMPISPTAVGTAQAVLTVTSTGEGVQTFLTPERALTKNGGGSFTWIDLDGTLTPTWSGTLTKATVGIRISNSSDYYMDRVSMTDITYSKDSYVIDRQLLSPAVNPFGQTNEQGIYVINCSGMDVIVGRSRIVGTLVFLNPGIKSAIQHSVHWTPAIPNYPALVTDRTLTIGLSAAGLSEAGIGVNLNPAGTPFPFPGGTSNTTAADSYSSTISGIVYSTSDLKFTASSTITGLVIAHNKIDVSASSLVLNYGFRYLNEPPPMFDIGGVTMRVVPGTWQRSVD